MIFGWRASFYLSLRRTFILFIYCVDRMVMVCVCVFEPNTVRRARSEFHQLIIMSCRRHWAFDFCWIEIITQRAIHCDRQAVDCCCETETINSIDKRFNGNRIAPHRHQSWPWFRTSRNRQTLYRFGNNAWLEVMGIMGQMIYVFVCLSIVCGIGHWVPSNSINHKNAVTNAIESSK